MSGEERRPVDVDELAVMIREAVKVEHPPITKISRRNDFIATVNRGWRPFVGWGVGFVLVMFTPALMFLVYRAKIESITPWIGLFTALSSLWIALAGIRQFNKNKQAEVDRDLHITQLTGQDREKDYYSESRQSRQSVSREEPLFDDMDMR